MIKVTGEPSSDIGDDESGNSNRKARDVLEYGKQESGQD